MRLAVALLAWLAFAGIATAATPTLAPKPPGATDMPVPGEMAGARVVVRAMQATTPAERLKVLDEALPLLLRPTRFRGLVQCMRANFLAESERLTDALAPAEECLRLRPDDARALWLVAVATIEKDAQRGARLMLAALKASPEPAGQLDRDMMASVFRRLAYAGERPLGMELLRALGEAGWQRDDVASLSAFAAEATIEFVAAGDPEGASRTLPLILVPERGLMLMVDRRLDPIRDELARWSGGTLELQRKAYRDAAAAAWQRDPTPGRRLDYAAALEATGGTEAAIALLKEGLASKPDTREAQWHHSVMAIHAATLLWGAGRGSEGLALLRAAKEQVRGSEGERNLMPNEARLLIRLGRGREALALLNAEMSAADEVESPAAMGFYTAIRACALASVGDRAGARAALAEVRSRYLTNLGATVIALACTGTPDERARHYLDTLDDRGLRASVLLAWARAARPDAAASRDDVVRDLAGLRGHPALRARMEALGRPLPAGTEAAVEKWRLPEIKPVRGGS